MPSYTITVSAENAVRIKNAVDARIEREDGETDLQLFKRWLKGQLVELVFRYERQEAQSAVAGDDGIAEIT